VPGVAVACTAGAQPRAPVARLLLQILGEVLPGEAALAEVHHRRLGGVLALLLSRSVGLGVRVA
jgi:hypothetical protein